MDLLYGQKKTFSGGTKVGNLKPVWEVNQNMRFASFCPIVHGLYGHIMNEMPY